MNQIDAGHHLEQFAEDVGRGPVALRGHVELARIGFRIGDELGNGFGGDRWIDDHDKESARDSCDRRNVPNEIEIEVRVERGVDGVCRRCPKQRVAIRRRLHNDFGADIAAGARPVLNDELLAEPLRQSLTDQARDNVRPDARRKADDDADRPRRIGLRPRHAGNGWKRDCACCQMQKSPTGKFHDGSRHRRAMGARTLDVWNAGRFPAAAILRVVL